MNIRTSKPGAGNKFYIRKANGGYSTCITGSPTDSNCNVLANCVGYACGRFNEIIGSMKYPSLNCNAENFIERAKNTYGLKISSVPTLGGIMVWQKGDTLSGNDGAGHVAVVERIDSGNQIYTSESGYGGSAFWNSVRTNSNGRWGLSSGYKFRGCIINPAIGDIHWNENTITSNVSRDTSKNQIQVLINDLRVRTGAGTDKGILGFASKGYYNYSETNTANGYTWYKIANNQWIASNDGWTSILPKQEEQKTYYTVQKGDTLWAIAKKYYGDGSKYPKIATANGIKNANIIHTGQKLLIP